MEDEIDKKWQAYSKRSPRFNIFGYSTKNGDYRDDAVKAMEILSKAIKEPIPSDVEMKILSTRQ